MPLQKLVVIRLGAVDPKLSELPAPRKMPKFCAFLTVTPSRSRLVPATLTFAPPADARSIVRFRRKIPLELAMRRPRVITAAVPPSIVNRLKPTICVDSAHVPLIVMRFGPLRSVIVARAALIDPGQLTVMSCRNGVGQLAVHVVWLT